MKLLISVLIILLVPSLAIAKTENVSKFAENYNALVVTDEMTDKTQRLLTAADKTENKLVLTLRISIDLFNNQKNLMCNIRMVDTGNDPISSKNVALRIDKNPKMDFEGFLNKTGSGISFLIKDRSFINQMKTGQILKAQVGRNSGYRVVDFSLAGFNEGLAWLNEKDTQKTAGTTKNEEPKKAKTELPIRLKAKDGSGWADFKIISDRIRIIVTRSNDILDYDVALNVDGKRIKEYRASKGFDQKYEGATVMFTPDFKERDAIQKGSEMCITVRSVTRGRQKMCFDVGNIYFH